MLPSGNRATIPYYVKVASLECVMSTKRFPKESQIAAVKQVAERCHPDSAVARRLGVSTNNMYHWLKRYGNNSEYYQEVREKGSGIKGLQKELRILQRVRVRCPIFCSTR